MRFERPAGTGDARSLPGMVQRGRGAGWLAAVKAPDEGRLALLACVAYDPRWDRQVESREEFYATLALALGVPAGEVTAAGPADSEKNWLTAGILTEMAARGDATARDLIAAGPAEDDPPVSEEPTPSTSPLPLSSPVAELLRHEKGTGRRAVLHRLRTTSDPHDIAALRQVADDPARNGFRLAMQILGERGDTTLTERAGEILAGDPTGTPRAGSLRYLCGLPAEDSLPVAREWFGLGDGRGDAADMILARHAHPEDVARVRRRLQSQTSYYTQGDMVDGLARVPEMGPYPELRTVFTEACYSWLRHRAARAMAASDPDYPALLATECLWDCEATTRGVGARYAPLTGQVASRLAELAGDEIHETDVRAVAASRLKGGEGR